DPFSLLPSLHPSMEVDQEEIHYELLAWSNVSPVLALSSTLVHQGRATGQLHLITYSNNSSGNEDGEIISSHSTVTHICWAPSSEWLVVAWSDGRISVSNVAETYDVEVFAPISCLAWSTDGKVFCCIDNKGEIRVYTRERKKWTRKSTARVEEGAKCAIGLTLSDKDDSTSSLFAIGGAKSKVYFIDAAASIHKVFDADSSIVSMHEFKEREALVCLSSDNSLRILTVTGKTQATETKRVKLTGKIENIRLHLCEGLLFICNGDKDIRVWNLRTDENSSLPMGGTTFKAGDVPCCISARPGVICAGTTGGKMITWRKKKQSDGSFEWLPQPPDTLGDTIVALTWSTFCGSLAVSIDSTLIVLQDNETIAHFRNKIAAVQNTPSSINLINSDKGGFHELRLNFQVKGIFLADKQLTVWSNDTIAVMDVQSSLVAHPSTFFQCTARDVALVQQTVVTLENDKVNMRTLQGTVKQQITVPEMEGDPFAIHVNKNWLVLATTNNFLRVYDLSKREARQQHLAKGIELEGDCVLSEVRINVNGTRVAATYGRTNRPDGLLVWDAESDTVSSFSFKTGLTEEQQLEEEAERATSQGARPVTAAARRIERDRSRFCLPLHKTGSLQWDEVDPRFLVVEARPENTDGGDSYVMTALATAEFGLLPHALQTLSPQTSRLIGVAVPNVYFIKNKEVDEEDSRADRIVAKLLIVRTLQEFAGIEESDSASRDAMLNFCLFLTLGRIDDAFKSIKFIRSEKVWQQMASMSVKARRLDVATVCLGHMGEARAAASLRRAAGRGETEKERCALLAIYLGMLDEAESLYISCRRWDMVVKMFVARLKWAEALKIAGQHTRIDEKRLYHQYAKSLEEKGDIQGAIENYERAGTHIREVTRMLCRDHSRELEAYVRKKREPELQKWWASWLEITGNIDGALNFYSVAEDIPSIVRILLQHDRLEEAIAKAEETKNPGGYLLVARKCEEIGRVEDAVNLYSKANAISSAIRLAQENEMVDKMATLCLMAGPREMANGAAFYEDIPGHAQTAVMLYHKAGMIGRALDVAFRTEQYNAMDMVTMELTPQSDKTTLERAAEFFLKNNNYEKAAELLAMAQKLPEAIRFCDERNVRMTEKLTTLLTPSKEVFPDLPTRKRLLIAVGELCVAQGAFQAAAKKFAQAGAMVEAISALIRSSDTSRIMAFASIARSKEVYVMAANYLQTTNWREDVELCKNIESFYNKAQAYDHLAGFYISCAQMELDEVGAIPNAIHALDEAEKVAVKAKESSTLNNVKTFQAECARMLKILRSFEVDPADALRQLRAAQVGPNLNLPESIAVMIKALAHDSKWKNAWSCIEELVKRCGSSKPTNFVPRIFLDQIADEVGQKRLELGVEEGDSDEGELEEVDFSHQMKRQGI
ncbi:hypothetical protein PMAYCL1PPCAC_06463, partial [Pristionchus mayeri]